MLVYIVWGTIKYEPDILLSIKYSHQGAETFVSEFDKASSYFEDLLITSHEVSE